jgi:uncharacterized protein YjiS (DUF1127 family)
VKPDKNIVHIHHKSAIPLSQIRNFHTKAHCLRSRAFTSFVTKLFSFVINLPKRFADYRRTRQAYRQLCAMDRRQLRDIGLTRNDLERIKLGQAGILTIQQEQAALNVKNTLPKNVVIEGDHEVTVPRAMAQ